MCWPVAKEEKLMRRATFLPAPRVLLAATVGALGLVDLTVGVVVLRAAPITFWPLTSLRGTLAALAWWCAPCQWG